MRLLFCCTLAVGMCVNMCGGSLHSCRISNPPHQEKILNYPGVSNFVLNRFQILKSGFFIGSDGSVIACGYTKQHSAMVIFYPAQLCDTTLDKGSPISLTAKLRHHRLTDPKIRPLILTCNLPEYLSATHEAELLVSPCGCIEQIIIRCAFEVVCVIRRAVFPKGYGICGFLAKRFQMAVFHTDLIFQSSVLPMNMWRVRKCAPSMHDSFS